MPVAQWIEHRSSKPMVAGSIPAGRTSLFPKGSNCSDDEILASLGPLGETGHCDIPVPAFGHYEDFFLLLGSLPWFRDGWRRRRFCVPENILRAASNDFSRCGRRDPKEGADGFSQST